MRATHDGRDGQARLAQLRDDATSDEAGRSEDRDLARAGAARLGDRHRGRRLGLARDAFGHGLAPAQDLGRVARTDRRRGVFDQRAVKGQHRLAHADEERILAAPEPEREAHPIEEHAPAVATQRSAAPAAGQEAVPEVEPERLALAGQRVVEQVDLERTVAADDLHGVAREALPEGQVDLRRAVLALGRDRPAVVEHLPGVQLARREQRGRGRTHLADQGVHLAQRVDGLLEDDVARGAEHPMREVARVELHQRHREGDLDVLDLADAAGPDLFHHAREGRVEEVVVVDRERQAQAPGLGLELRTFFAVEDERLLDEDADAQIQDLVHDALVEVGRHQHVRHLDADLLETRELVDRVRDAVPLGGRTRAVEVGVDDAHRLGLGELLENVQVEVGDEAGADHGRAHRSRHAGLERVRQRGFGGRGRSALGRRVFRLGGRGFGRSDGVLHGAVS